MRVLVSTTCSHILTHVRCTANTCTREPRSPSVRALTQLSFNGRQACVRLCVRSATEFRANVRDFSAENNARTCVIINRRRRRRRRRCCESDTHIHTHSVRRPSSVEPTKIELKPADRKSVALSSSQRRCVMIKYSALHTVCT